MNPKHEFVILPYSDQEDWINSKHIGLIRFKPTTRAVLEANRKNIAKATNAIKGIPHPWTNQPDNKEYLKSCIKRRTSLKKKWGRLRKKGWSLAKIGREFSIHKQRVWTVLNDYRIKGLL